MAQVHDEELYEEAKALLEPGDIELVGVIVHTDLTREEEPTMNQLTIELNDVIAEHAGKGETYIHAGENDPEFGANQFQGLTLEDEAFVWECQQLLRDGTFDLVFYYEATADQDAIVDAVEALGYDVTPVP